LLAFGLIIWITQAVRLLDLIGEEGNSIKTYFLYILSIMPKFFSRISLIIFFISLVVTISKFEDHNELRALWFSGLEKKKFINYLLRSSIILILILVIIRCFVIPYFSSYSRYLLLNSSVGTISPLLKQNNFNNPLKKITIYVGKKNQINELEDIILFEDNAELRKTIIAKSGIIINENNKNLLVLVDGSIQEERKDKKISILDFDKTTLDLSQYNKKTVDYYKFNEMLFFELIKRLYNKNDTQLQNIIGELNDRIIMPLFIPSLVLLACFLFITNKEAINNNLLKIIIFTYGIVIIIISEVLLDHSSKKIYASLFLYATPFLFLIINWVLLNYFLNRENIKS
ncbi:MAG: LptF/LptG family permease, partial [Candidatus Fonsibacter sp.]|nr:LptF/LptG family permease [Candidatus Fonsibacter sp.]